MLEGILLSLGSALMMNVGNLLEKRAVARMHDFSIRRPVRIVLALLGSRVWMSGFASSVAAVVLQIVAFTVAPIVAVQAIFAGGLIILFIASQQLIGEIVGRHEVAGILTIVGALVLVSWSLEQSGHTKLSSSAWTAVVVSLGSVAVTVFAFVILRHVRASLLWGLLSGVLYGAATIGTVGASALVERHGAIGAIAPIFASPYPYIFLAASVPGLLVFQYGIQQGRISIVAPTQGVISSVYIVIAGSLVFQESLPHPAYLKVLRVLGFVGVMIGIGFLARTPRPQVDAATADDPRPIALKD